MFHRPGIVTTCLRRSQTRKEKSSWDIWMMGARTNIWILVKLMPPTPSPTLMIHQDHPLASGFDVRQGSVDVTVPDVPPESDYIIVCESLHVVVRGDPNVLLSVLQYSEILETEVRLLQSDRNDFLAVGFAEIFCAALTLFAMTKVSKNRFH
jgi:hypothetical protein